MLEQAIHHEGKEGRARARAIIEAHPNGGQDILEILGLTENEAEN